jgi:YesN/AraC family two-component response regulator
LAIPQQVNHRKTDKFLLLLTKCLQKILIVDDHEIVREGIRTLIFRARPEWEICGEASNGEQALAAAQSLQPDVVVLDITMPKLSGLESASQVAHC